MKNILRSIVFSALMTLLISSNSYADLNTGLLVYFPFDQKSVSGLIHDESGSGNDGTVVGAPTYEPNGAFHGAYHFTARSGSGCCSWYQDYILLDGNPTANMDELTVSLWIKTDDPRNNYKIASAAAWPPGSGWVLGTQYPEMWDQGGGPVFSTEGCSAYDTSLPDAGQWVHIAMTYDGTAFREYFNGKVVRDCPSLGKKIGGALGQKLAIAAWPQHGFGYDGLIDEFRIYNRALSTEEVCELSKGKECIQCVHATYSFKKQILTVPFVEMPVIDFLTGKPTGEMELWTSSLRQVSGTTNRFRLAFGTTAQVTSGLASSCPATYIVETGTLLIPYVDIPTGITVGKDKLENGMDVFKAIMSWEPMGKSFIVQEVKQLP